MSRTSFPRTTFFAIAFASIAGLARGQSTEPDPGWWALSDGNGPLPGAVFHSMTLDSTDTIKDENGREDVTPQLSFHCASGNSDVTVRIEWRRFISSFNTDIGFKVDGGRTLWQKWGVDQSNTVTTSRNDADASALIDYIGSGQVLAVDITPYAGSPIVVQFDLAGFAIALDALRAKCGANDL